MKLCDCGKLWDDCMGLCNLKLGCETCEDHTIHDCLICPTKNDDSKYKRAWESLPSEIKGKFHLKIVHKILSIMNEVMKNETN